MPNGGDHSKVEWEEAQMLLQKIEEKVITFAETNDMQISSNYHNVPSRSLGWGDTIEKVIQIYQENQKGNNFSLWIAATLDKGEKRYWKKMFLKKDVQIEEIVENLEDLLTEAKTTLDSWQETDLEPAY